MAEEKNIKGFIKRIAWRILKATLVSFVTFCFVYLIPTLLFPIGVLPADYEPLFYFFVGTMVFFAVTVELFSGTIIHHALKTARTLIMMGFFVYSFNGGIVAVDVEIVHVIVDLRVLLAMLILINLLGLAKNILGAVDFLSEKTEFSPERA